MFCGGRRFGGCFVGRGKFGGCFVGEGGLGGVLWRVWRFGGCFVESLEGLCDRFMEVLCSLLVVCGLTVDS